jgi:predicted unusual protein kinase regulating ubiquinone biosynthesis (AarF/ABC1/UbiB family)
MSRRIAAIAALVAAVVFGRQLVRRGGVVAARRVEVARLAGRIGRRGVVNRARRVFADDEQRAALDDELQLHTAEEVARTLGQMKGALMKVGQLASFVDDGMPEPVRAALEQLQQSAPPMAPELAAQVVREELGGSPREVFAEWDDKPLAAASIGQVHRAVTHDGRVVAVKVQYPDVAESIESDLANLDIATMVMPMVWKSLDAHAVAEELRARIMEELDYTLEAANQRAFASWYEGHPFIHVPSVVDDLSTRRVLTTDLADGVRFQELETWSQTERDRAAEAIYRFVFRSFYRFHAFNGDPHPGNYLFSGDGRVTFLDYGLVKRFTDADIEGALRMADAAVINPDIHRLREVTEGIGYFERNAPLSDERMAEYSLMFWRPVMRKGVHTITAEWATELIRGYMFGQSEFSDVVQYANVPADYVFLQRINLGVFAILGRLNATADWRGISEEIWPTVDAPPVSPMGEAEAAWLARRTAVPAF